VLAMWSWQKREDRRFENATPIGRSGLSEAWGLRLPCRMENFRNEMPILILSLKDSGAFSCIGY
jgi:hypothetical protein